MSLLGSFLGNAIAGGAQATADLTSGWIKDDAATAARNQQFQSQSALQAQAAQIAKDRDATLQSYAQTNAKAASDAQVDVHQRNATFDTSPDQIAANAAFVGAQTKAKENATPLKLNPGEVVKDPVTGAIIAKGEGLTGPEATLRATSMRIAADRADALAQAQAGGAGMKVTYQTVTGADGTQTLVAVPTTIQAGSPVTGTPVTNADGTPVGKGSKQQLTEQQSQALLYGTRMQDSDKILRDLSAKGIDTPSYTKQFAESLPVVGGAAGRAVNGYVSPERQQVEQAQRDFVNAVLRRESGAAISSSEFDSATKQYFNQPGDSDAVKKQKSSNRETAIRGLIAAVPESQRGALGAAPPRTPNFDIDVGALLNTPSRTSSGNRVVHSDF